MALNWKARGLQARFMLVSSIGVLALAAATLIVIGWFEYSGLETKLRTFAENELKSLNSLVDSAMEHRLNDGQNVAIKVFNGWFESRNKDYPASCGASGIPRPAPRTGSRTARSGRGA